GPDQPGIVGTSQKAPFFPGIVIGQVQEAIPARQGNCRRRQRALLAQSSYQGTKPREVVRRWGRIQVGTIMWLAGEHVVQPPSVAWMGVIHTAQQAILVSLAREKRQVFADANPRHTGVDAPEFATDFRWRVGLEVPKVDMAGAAEEVHQQAGPCPSEA